jgi:hypothetical protein
MGEFDLHRGRRGKGTSKAQYMSAQRNASVLLRIELKRGLLINRGCDLCQIPITIGTATSAS